MSSGLGAEFRVTVFGGLRLWRGEVDVDLGPSRQRTLLGMLIVASGAVVGISDLVEALWGWGDPPASAVNQLHRMVGQLRRTLEPSLSTREAGRCLRSSGSGYRLDLSIDECDLPAFRHVVDASRADAAAGRWSAAAASLGRVLGMAAGEPFAGLDDEVLARSEFAQVRRERLAAAAQALDAGLACGELGPVLGPCERIAATAPLDEALQARLIRALAMVGRRSEALELAERVRRALSVELGVDPGPDLAAALLDALGGDASQPSASTASVRLVPRQLPPEVQGFIERSGLAHVPVEEIAGRTVTVAITAVGGMGGVGKTALAVHWAHQLAPHFPDGQLYVNLRGFDPGGRIVSPSDALGLLLESMGVVLAGLGDEPVEARSARFRTLIAGRRMLVLLDNARDSAQVRPLLPSTAGCLVLVTSRNQLAGLVAREGARAVSLDRLDAEDARGLLDARIGAARVAAEPAAVDALITACAGLPLALSMVAAKAVLNPKRRLADLAAEIGANRLDALTGEADDGVRATFDASYATLSAHAARLFRLLAVHPGPEISLSAAVSLSGAATAEVRSGFGELSAAAMVVEPTTNRFVLHDLLRAYADEQLDDDERKATEARLVAHYVESTRNAYLTAGRPPLVALTEPAARVVAETFTDLDDATAWYARERAVLVATVRLAITKGMRREAALIVLDWRPMNQMTDAPADTLPLSLAALGAAMTLRDPLLQAELHRDVAAKYYRTERLAEAQEHFLAALSGFRTLGDLVGQANTLRNLSQSAHYAGRRDDSAITFGEQAVTAARASGRADVIAGCLLSHCEGLIQRGECETALPLLEESLTLATAAGLTYVLSRITATTADCLYRLGHFAEALTAAQSSLTWSGVGDESHLFSVLALLAAAAFEQGDLALAQDSVRRAEPLLATRSDWRALFGPDIELHIQRYRGLTARLKDVESSGA